LFVYTHSLLSRHVSSQGANYRLEYIKEAVAEADAVTKLTGLMKQRRRWLNGTFFAMLYALGNMGRIWTESSHSLGRKLVLTAEFIYLLVNLIVGTWWADMLLGLKHCSIYPVAMLLCWRAAIPVHARQHCQAWSCFAGLRVTVGWKHCG
jgi:cellulose synthase/poly-beta-1,6-N-acetylglucosamine synthase-like glycosyltransferase